MDFHTHAHPHTHTPSAICPLGEATCARAVFTEKPQGSQHHHRHRALIRMHPGKLTSRPHSYTSPRNTKRKNAYLSGRTFLGVSPTHHAHMRTNSIPYMHFCLVRRSIRNRTATGSGSSTFARSLRYHHVTVLLFCWHCYVVRSSLGLPFMAMNYTVHAVHSLRLACLPACLLPTTAEGSKQPSHAILCRRTRMLSQVMYTYYWASAMRVWPKRISPMCITVLQLLQMAGGVWCCAASAYYKRQAAAEPGESRQRHPSYVQPTLVGSDPSARLDLRHHWESAGQAPCYVANETLLWGGLMYGSYFALFAQVWRACPITFPSPQLPLTLRDLADPSPDPLFERSSWCSASYSRSHAAAAAAAPAPWIRRRCKRFAWAPSPPRRTQPRVASFPPRRRRHRSAHRRSSPDAHEISIEHQSRPKLLLPYATAPYE
jgi:hypothetical protein